MPTQTYEPRGGAVELLKARDGVVVISGPAGTGKSLAALWKVHLTALLVPGSRQLILRQTHASLTATTLQTFERFVVSEALESGDVTWFGGSGRRPPAYEYANGSQVLVGGLDAPGKLLSLELDRAFVDEANQVSETAVQIITTRLRADAPTYKQLVLATNPDHPQHHLLNAVHDGRARMIHSKHEDNPYLVNADGTPTEAGADYLDRLRSLSGIRRARYYEGRWVAAEGVVWPEWSEATHLIDRFPIPDDWRHIESIDFGFQNPMAWGRFAIDPDGRMYLIGEMSVRQRLVEDFARDIQEAREANGWGKPEAIVADHDAEDRATLERYLGEPTIKARKAVRTGVQAVANRLMRQKDGKARLYVFRDSMMSRDPLAASDKRPRGFVAEVGGYVWETVRGTDGVPKESPKKENDHACFVAGTSVRTEQGPTPIESVSAGDLVWTRQGLREVTDAGVTSLDASVFSVELTNGQTLTGTGNHPVWVAGQGWVRLDKLRYGDILQEWQSESKSSSSTASSSDAIQTQSRSLSVGTSFLVSQTGNGVSVGFTKKSGKPPTDPSRTGTKSTTRTLTPSITTWATWCVCPGTNTTGYTRNACQRSLFPPSVCNISTPYDIWPLSGTGLTKVVSGTGRGPLSISSAGVSVSSRDANTVGKSSCTTPKTPSLGSARTSASPLGAGLLGSTTSLGSAPSAVKPLRSTGTQRPGSVDGFVPDATGLDACVEPSGYPTTFGRVNSVTSSSAPHATRPTSSVPVRVLRVRTLHERQAVYNITVEGCPEYYANGVLVHNCDMLRYAVMYLDGAPPAKLGNPASVGQGQARQGGKWSRPVGR